jgi:hypothetical protein
LLRKATGTRQRTTLLLISVLNLITFTGMFSVEYILQILSIYSIICTSKCILHFHSITLIKDSYQFPQLISMVFSLFLRRFEDVNHYDSRAPYGKMAHPWPDHFYPLHVAMGAAGENAKAKLVHHSWDNGTLSYASYQFTARK